MPRSVLRESSTAPDRPTAAASAPFAAPRPSVATESAAPRAETPPPAAPLVADGRPVPVVHLVAELAPFARSGGLGEAVSSLARHQAASGVPTTVVMPLYEAARAAAGALAPVGDAFTVEVGPHVETVRLWRRADASLEPADCPRVRFVESHYFDRPHLYGPPGGDYADNALRYATFCRAALAALPTLAADAGAPDPAALVLHAHDWHTALAPVYLRTVLAGDAWLGRVRAVLSVHNAGYQGHFSAMVLPQLGLPWELFNWRQLEWHGHLNLLKGGLAFADMVTTVSPTHAHELRTFAGGFGLDGAFVALRDRLVGITNGIDQDTWDPARDPLIAASYSADDLAGKRVCRVALQRDAGLRALDGVPIFAMSARLVSQKGLDLILDDPSYFALDAQFVFLGRGEPRYEAALRAIAARAPARISAPLTFTEELEHHLLAGADLCLMPSQYEPCGLTQMRAQRYGTIPVARRVGGLADTIEDGVTGFLFDDYTTDDFVRAVMRAVDQYQDATGWHHMMREAMARDFGWARSAERYLAVYRRAVEERAAARG